MTDVSEFDRCAPWIEAALGYAGGTHSVEDVRAAVAVGRMQLWPGHAAVVLTEVVQYPRLKAVRVFAAGGDMDEIWRIEEAVAAWGSQIGCSRVEGCGRPGWQKSAAQHGYGEARVFMWRNI